MQVISFMSMITWGPVTNYCIISVTNFKVWKSLRTCFVKKSQNYIKSVLQTVGK